MSASWAELVSAATVGTAVRPLATGPGDPAAALLDAAALATAARRAGRPLRHAPAPEPLLAPADDLPELSPTAGRILAGASSVALLEALLRTTAAAGRRLPAPLLPALLEAATRNHALRPVVAPVLGARGAWLAGLRPEWVWATRPVRPPDEPPAGLTDLVAAQLATDPRTLRLAELEACRRPWPPALAGAVLHLLDDAATHGDPLTPFARQLVRLAGVGLPTDTVERLRALADRSPAHTTWPYTVRGLAATVAVRATFARELT